MRKFLKQSKCCVFCANWEGDSPAYIPNCKPAMFDVPQTYGHCRQNHSLKQPAWGTCSKFRIDIKYEKYLK